MAGSNRAGSGSSADSSKISEELFEAFNMDDYDEGASRRKPAKKAAPVRERKAPVKNTEDDEVRRVPARSRGTAMARAARPVREEEPEREDRRQRNVPARSSEGRDAQRGSRRRRRPRKKILLGGAAVLLVVFLLELIIGVKVLSFPFVPTFFIFLFDIVIGFLLAPVVIFAPIIFIVIQLIAGFIAGHFLLAFFGAILLALAQAILFLLK